MAISEDQRLSQKIDDYLTWQFIVDLRCVLQIFILYRFKPVIGAIYLAPSRIGWLVPLLFYFCSQAFQHLRKF